MDPRSFQASRVKRVVSDRCYHIRGHRSLHTRWAHTLPNELSSFVGRECQIDDLASRLRADRLVTLTGAGGIGKTRLALQVARRLKTGGTACAWVPLSSTRTQSELVASVSTALFGGGVASLTPAIGDQELLLVLDNCEQVIEACAELVLCLLEECSGLRILATAREPLGVPGEVVYAVPPLVLPEEAVTLFFDRALARDPRLPVTPKAEAVAGRICAACDGVPLAIELAAACTGSMTLAEIADRLDNTLGLLRFGSRAAPARQHSIRASIDWSHQLLPTNQQVLLRRLSVFEADFTLADAEWVCAFDGLQAIEIGYLLDRLVAQSLVRAARHGPTTSFSLWRPVRQYGLEQLVKAEELVCLQARVSEWSEGASVCSPMPSGPETRQESAALKPSTRRPELLSVREHSVVKLIAGGRSNREIADELVITKKTAEAHVSHILTKLGLASRVQIATWSLQQGAADANAVARRTR